MKKQKSNRDNEVIFTPRFIRNVVFKALLLFLVCNFITGLCDPLTWLGNLSAYNLVFPGRQRLPWSENPSVAYNLSLNNLDAMFASHEVSGGSKPEGEYRVLVFGDSSVWGFFLTNEETYTANLNKAQLVTQDGRHVRAYNLGFPTISLTKDLMLIDYAMQYQPDMVLWLVTLESFPHSKQIFTPLVQHNHDRVENLINTYNLNLDPNDEGFIRSSFWERTIIGQRRPLADLLRLQLYGVMWAATGIDQDIPDIYTPRQEDYETDDSFYEFKPPMLNINGLAFDVLSAGVSRAKDVPFLIINEPIFISQGQNSDIRYNFFYPRWAYDSYRQLMAERSELNGWNYLDMWDLFPGTEFTNTAIHLTPEASAQLASEIGKAILNLANGTFANSIYTSH